MICVLHCAPTETSGTNNMAISSTLSVSTAPPCDLWGDKVAAVTLIDR